MEGREAKAGGDDRSESTGGRAASGTGAEHHPLKAVGGGTGAGGTGSGPGNVRGGQGGPGSARVATNTGGQAASGTGGGPGAALAQQMDAAYAELREMAARQLRRERAGHTLEPTALVHSVFLRLVDASIVERADRAHFVALAAGVMRRVLVDHARARGAAKRGGGGRRVTMHSGVGVGAAGAGAEGGVIDVLALDEALTRLGAMDERQARMVEMRFFGGLTVEEVAAQMGVSKRTVESEWTTARAWLQRELGEGRGGDGD